MDRQLFAKSPIEVQTWLEDNPEQITHGWLDKDRWPVKSMADAKYFQLTSRQSQIIIPPEVKQRCFVRPAGGMNFEWDRAAERAAQRNDLELRACSIRSSLLRNIR